MYQKITAIHFTERKVLMDKNRIEGIIPHPKREIKTSDKLIKDINGMEITLGPEEENSPEDDPGYLR